MSDKFQEIEFHQVKWLVILSYFFGLTINVFSLKQPLLVILPPIALLIVLFWAVQLLRNSHLLVAFSLGLLYDALYQTLLGSHALLFVVITFFMLRIRLRFRTYRVWQQSLIVGFYLLIYQGLYYLIFSPQLDGVLLNYFWLMPVIASLLWPFIVALLRGLSNRVSTL